MPLNEYWSEELSRLKDDKKAILNRVIDALEAWEETEIKNKDCYQLIQISQAADARAANYRGLINLLKELS
jgi:hypothetical protein